MNALEKKFLSQIKARRLVDKGERILVALSGGPDSMAMLSLFTALRPVLHLQLAVAHCNFLLRGRESDGDEDFVREAALRLGMECFVERFDTRLHATQLKKSLEETARILRYGFFDKVLEEQGFSKVATAHHVSDNAETILFNLFRGASLPALKGIRARNDRIIRPMLLLHKAEIKGYLKEKGIASRIDSSNSSDDYDRNFIRNRVIPLIEERFAHKLMPSLQRVSEQAGELEEFLELYFENLAECEPGLSLVEGRLEVGALRKLTVFEQKEIFKRALREMDAPVDAQALQKLVDLLNSRPGKVVMAGRGLQVLWKGRVLCFLRDPLSSPGSPDALER
ncbi:tRNA lysidine(34) synthetase TilS [Chlorobium sp. KB01]|uniref:tRNA lysidine(34) synthetase TilS n=1 Tax=Chlorobium sp. KB01 TaxID=1917528 RepID=UPI000978BB3B|nr:tRNA lysidine(34) synthetase TilS [Chlorobium sp. KB01]